MIDWDPVVLIDYHDSLYELALSLNRCGYSASMFGRRTLTDCIQSLWHNGTRKRAVFNELLFIESAGSIKSNCNLCNLL